MRGVNDVRTYRSDRTFSLYTQTHTLPARLPTVFEVTPRELVQLNIIGARRPRLLMRGGDAQKGQYACAWNREHT